MVCNRLIKTNMDKKVKFDSATDKGVREKVSSAPRMARDSRPTERKNTIDRGVVPGKQKQVMGFEDYLKKKPMKNNLKTEGDRNPPLKPPVPKQKSRAEKPQSQPQQEKPSSLKKVSQFKENNEVPYIEPKEKVEVSLENIFDSRLLNEGSPKNTDQYLPHIGPVETGKTHMANKSVVENRSLVHEAFVVHNSSSMMPNQRMQNVGASPSSPNRVMNDESQIASKQIRGLFKKEVYGDDETKRKEAQLRMKKELEMQMEEKKMKKEQEKRRKEEEDKQENEKYNKYMEKEKMRREEEERRDLEVKRKKELFTIQQAAMLEEFKQNTTAERRSKIGKKQSITDATTSQGMSQPTNGNLSNPILNKGVAGVSDRMSIQSNFNTNNTVYGHQPISTAGYMGGPEPHEIKTDSNFGGLNPSYLAAMRTNPNQSISPPTIPIDSMAANGYNPVEAQINLYQRQFTPMTNISNNGNS